MESIRKWLGTKHVGQAFQPAVNWPEIRFFTKEDLKMVSQYQRRLPHWELEGSSYFVTFRAREMLENPLRDPVLAGTVEEALWFYHEERYVLYAYVIMANHVHLLMKPLLGWSLAGILQAINGFTARSINKALGRKGSFWQDENFDHLIRNERDWVDKFQYIHNNPVSAGLVDRPQDYPFSSLVSLHGKGRLESLPHHTKQYSGRL